MSKKSNIFKEFKKFAFKGNVIDLAVGVMIGAAFGSIVTSLVNDIVMPVFGLIIGTENLDQLYLVLKAPADGTSIAGLSLADAQAAGATVMAYGKFIAAIINFLLIAIIIFVIVSLIKKAASLGKKKEEEAPTKPARICPYCRQEVADDATRCPHCTSDISADAR